MVVYIRKVSKMSEIRSLKRVVEGKLTKDGAGVKLRRVFSHKAAAEFDPFLLLDAFDSEDPNDYIKGFPWHPHRGIETVTYLISGRVEHGDSLGNIGLIKDGGCQWMTAGSGVIHQEMPKECERMLGVQLWLNLPSEDKMTKPSYRDVSSGPIPTVFETGCSINVISGVYDNHHGGAWADYVDTLFLDVKLDQDKSWQLKTEPVETLFIYIISGSAMLNDGKTYDNHRALLFNTGKYFRVKAVNEDLRFLLFMAPPLKEPVVWGDSIVMNTQREIDKAYREIERKDFIKHHED